MNTVTVYLPPEVCGCLSLAQRHLAASRLRRRYHRYDGGERKRRHESKVQKLVAKAARLLEARGM